MPFNLSPNMIEQQARIYEELKRTINETRDRLVKAGDNPPAESIAMVAKMIGAVGDATSALILLTELMVAVKKANSSSDLPRAVMINDNVKRAHQLTVDASSETSAGLHVKALDMVIEAINLVDEGKKTLDDMADGKQGKSDNVSMAEALGAPSVMFILYHGRRW